MEVKDKIVIVTGAGSGIGKAAAKLFAHHGATVIVSDIQLDGAVSTVEEIAGSGGQARSNQTNVAVFDEVERLVKDTVDEFGRLDVMVNNAGRATTNAAYFETQARRLGSSDRRQSNRCLLLHEAGVDPNGTTRTW